jgi:RNA polymerase sigma-70 factor (ECF subfamily)
MEDRMMSNEIKIRIQDYYEDYTGEKEYIHVSPEVYEIITNTFRKESHAEQMRDFRNRIPGWYGEGSTEDLLNEASEPLEDIVIRQIDIQILQRAMQTLPPIQKERLFMYFFQGLTASEIAKECKVSQQAISMSIQVALKKLKNFMNEGC